MEQEDSSFVAERDGPMSEGSERHRVRRLSFGEAPQAGFTLIELLVVLLVIGALLAIVIPRVLTTTSTADNPAAQVNLLYPNSNQSLGGCGGTDVSTVGHVGAGSNSVTGTRSADAKAVSINSEAKASWLAPSVFSAGTAGCGSTAAHKPAQTTVATTGHVGTGERLPPHLLGVH
jgi:prepilin-type N-terminal cleavage/methylation domain-containing protein